MYGEWRTSKEQYMSEVRRWASEIGNLQWAASCDWMCEEYVVASVALEERIITYNKHKYRLLIKKLIAKGRKLTAESIRDAKVKACLPLNPGLWQARILVHQRRTVASYIDLMQAAPEIQWLPVIQGYSLHDYMQCVELYYEAGICLHALPLVGLGSICRRQHTKEAERIIREISILGIKLHAFGFKQKGLEQVSDALASADSLAWSYQARRRPALDGCTGHKNCANCLRFALLWHEKVLGKIQRCVAMSAQMTFSY